MYLFQCSKLVEEELEPLLAEADIKTSIRKWEGDYISLVGSPEQAASTAALPPAAINVRSLRRDRPLYLV